MRRIGVLLPAIADNSEFQAGLGAFLQDWPQLGLAIGRNVRIDTRWRVLAQSYGKDANTWRSKTLTKS